jgi:16S rRNA (cytidine1402-2'-O)-methyltransferase
MTATEMRGRLYLVPNLLGVVPPRNVLPAHTIGIASGLRHFVVENAKPARQFLKALGTATPLQALDIAEIGDEPSPQRCAELLAPARAGNDVGMLSDAGCPGIADPGAPLVAAAHREGIVVTPLVGPSAILLALMASGMNGQGFTFHGYLPAKPAARTEAILRLESGSRQNGFAQLFIETPYRNAALLDALGSACRSDTGLCVAADLTMTTESVESRSIRDWRAIDSTRYAKRPAMFVLQAAATVPAKRGR